MQLSLMPICRYPATVVLIDDDIDLLRCYKRLISRVAPCVTFSDPDTALEFLTKMSDSTFAKRFEQNQQANDSWGQDYTMLEQEAYRLERFSDVAVVVIDYLMPKINGVELCQRLGRFPAQKIILTGEADEKIAVDAFNDGLIDAYIKKDISEVSSYILAKIQEHTSRYFLKLSAVAERSLVNSEYSSLSSCFTDAQFYDFFQRMLAEHEIVEHYLVSVPANFLLLDRSGSPSWLLVRDQAEMEDMIDLVVDQCTDELGEQAEELAERVKNKELILFRYNDNDYTADSCRWRSLFHPCKQVKCGDKVYFYAYINGNGGYDLAENKIIGFNQVKLASPDISRRCID